jgi:hypothetical protein
MEDAAMDDVSKWANYQCTVSAVIDMANTHSFYEHPANTTENKVKFSAVPRALRYAHMRRINSMCALGGNKL